MLAMTAFLMTQNEFGLFMISTAFGLGFAEIIPAYVLAIREIFPGRSIMADPGSAPVQRSRHGRRRLARRRALRLLRLYVPAFAAGVAANAINLMIVGTLVFRQRRMRLAMA